LPTPPPTAPPPPTPPLPPGTIQRGVLFDSKKAGNELINKKWVNVTTDTQGCVQLCNSTSSCVGMSYRIALQHCWLHAGCEHPTKDSNFNSALVIRGD
jgi:hypothetical protein